MKKSSTMEPDALFNLMVSQWFRKLGQLCGIDFYVKNYKPTILTYLLISMLIMFLMSCLYTIYSYDFDSKVIGVSALAFCLQGLVKYHSVLTNVKKIMELINFCLKIYKANTKSSPNKTYLEKSVNLTVWFFKNGMLLLIVTAIFTAVMPFMAYFFTGELQPIMPTYFPGINEKETVGYAILAIFHCSILFIFVVGTAAVDLGLMSFVIHNFTMAKLFQNAVNDLNATLKRKHQNNSNIKASLHNLILMHQDVLKFTSTVRRIYSGICFIQISMANTTMCLLMYVILVMNWFPAYFLFATAFFQVFEYSLLGTVIELANDRVYDSICNISVPDLPIREQRKVTLMMLIAQHPPYLNIGGIQELNVTIFVQSMRTTYSVGMLLVSSRS